MPWKRYYVPIYLVILEINHTLIVCYIENEKTYIVCYMIVLLL